MVSLMITIINLWISKDYKKNKTTLQDQISKDIIITDNVMSHRNCLILNSKKVYTYDLEV